MCETNSCEHHTDLLRSAKSKISQICRTHYRKPSDDDRNVTVKETVSDKERATRSVVNSFSWTTQCFICGSECDARRYRRSVDIQPTARSWSLVTDETEEQCENVFSIVLGVAEKQNDTELLLRPKSLPDGDMSNVKARYHRKWGCTKYIADTDEKKASTRKTMKKCLSISCDLTTLITNVCSPKHLGLAVHFHNEYGSRHIIDDLNNLSHCINFDKSRRFLTSAALHTIKEQRMTRSGGLVPKEVLQRNDGGGLIVGAGDNWDHNERTTDGKRTTHAMTSILVGDSPGQISETRLPRCNDETLRLSSINEIKLHEVAFYKKPHIRPEPVLREPVVEKSEIVVKESTTPAVQVAKMRERLYSLGRSADIFYEDVSMGNKVPPWSIYQSNFGDKVNIAASAMSFNPILMARPTDYSIIYMTLLRMKEVMNEMDQEFVPVFFDMGLLTKALEIVWDRQDTLSGVLPCASEMLMCFFAAFGKLYGESGLRNILSESGAYASGTVDRILKGKDFDRAMLAYMVLDEGLTKKYLKQFLNWCKSEDKPIPHEVTEAIQILIDTTRQRDDDKQTRESIYDESMLLTLYNSLEPLLDEYNKHGREKSQTFSTGSNSSMKSYCHSSYSWHPQG